MSRISSYPITPRSPYKIFCQAIANQTPPTDHTLAPALSIVEIPTAAIPGLVELPEDANNLELRFFAFDTGSTDPDGDDSTYQIFGYPDKAAGGGIRLGQMLCDVSVNYSSLLYTVNPFSGAAVGDWAENDNLTFTTNHVGAVVSGPVINDVGQALLMDVRGLKYIYVVCNDLAVSGTTVEQIMVLGRSF